jgi:hypothetical protein
MLRQAVEVLATWRNVVCAQRVSKKIESLDAGNNVMYPQSCFMHPVCQCCFDRKNSQFEASSSFGSSIQQLMPFYLNSPHHIPSFICRGYASTAPHFKTRSSALEAVAAGLVDPSSRILTHYKKNIDRPQLTARIMKRRYESSCTYFRDVDVCYPHEMPILPHPFIILHSTKPSPSCHV